jgi:hypothetical protein
VNIEQGEGTGSSPNTIKTSGSRSRVSRSDDDILPRTVRKGKERREPPQDRRDMYIESLSLPTSMNGKVATR